jgi:RNA-directed DNA polymerase
MGKDTWKEGPGEGHSKGRQDPMELRTKLTGISAKSLEQSGKGTLSWLNRHINADHLGACFERLNPKAAKGVDGVTTESYKENLKENLKDLVKRLKDWSYHPEPCRQVAIPKPGTDKKRILSIPCLEDKLVQMAVSQILEAVYEPIFLEYSHGFRPGRNCHGALKEVHQALYQNKQSIVLDIDINQFFDSIEHDKLMALLRLKVKDEEFLRLITRILKAGSTTAGTKTPSNRGLAQGSACSPILANIYAHYCLDLWFKEAVVPRSVGSVKLIRYCDDRAQRMRVSKPGEGN